VPDVADLDAAPGQLGAGLLDIGHHEVQPAG
jgi:hypothetical protein